MQKVFVCLEIGGTHLRLGLVDDELNLLYFSKIPTEQLAKAVDKVEFLSREFAFLIEQAGGIERVRALCLSLASLMDSRRRIVYSSPMISGFNDIPLADCLEEKFGLPVIMEKDVNLLLLYEVYRYNLPKDDIVSGIFLGTGLGNAICIDGKVYRGASGAACELGHIPIPNEKRICGCGKPGCMELRTGGKLIQSLTQQHGWNINRLFVEHSDSIEVQDILYHFALAVATEVTILDPAVVLIGGGVVEMEGFPLETVQKIVCQNVRAPYPRETLQFVKASGDSEAGVVGAAIHAKQFFKI